MRELHRLCIVAFATAFAVPQAALADACGAAEREMAFGEAAAEDAKDAADFKKAAEQFFNATQKAPKCAVAFFNLGVVQEKAGEYSSAKRAFETYLALAPKARDVAEVRKKIFKLEYRISQISAKPSAKPQSAPASKWAGLNGKWCGLNGKCGAQFRNEHWEGTHAFHAVTVEGDRVTILYDGSSYNRSARCDHISIETYRGTVDAAGRIVGTFVEDRRFKHDHCWPAGVLRPPPDDFVGSFTGTVTGNGNVIRLTGHGRSKQSGLTANRTWNLVKWN